MTDDNTQAVPTSIERMKDLEFFIGEWDAPGVFHETPFGPRKPIEMRVAVEAEGRGRWISSRTQELPTPGNPQPLTARYMWGFDEQSGEYTADWYDSNGGRARQRSAGWDNETFVFEGTIAMNGVKMPLRDTFTRQGPDAYHHIGEIDLGSGWIPVDEENAVRSAAAEDD